MSREYNPNNHFLTSSSLCNGLDHSHGLANSSSLSRRSLRCPLSKERFDVTGAIDSCPHGSGPSDGAHYLAGANLELRVEHHLPREGLGIGRATGWRDHRRGSERRSSIYEVYRSQRGHQFHEFTARFTGAHDSAGELDMPNSLHGRVCSATPATWAVMQRRASLVHGRHGRACGATSVAGRHGCEDSHVHSRHGRPCSKELDMPTAFWGRYAA